MGAQRTVIGVLCAAVLCVPASGAAPRAAPARPLVTGFVLAGVSDWTVELDRARVAGARVARLTVSWPAIAPGRPASRAEARDPGSAGSRWAEIDRILRLLASRRIEPIVSIFGAPEWAQKRGPRTDGGAFRPDPAAFADFVRAAARRYSGDFEDLPRVRFWQVWNEPNLAHYLNPQFVGGRLVAHTWYRQMVNRFAAAVKDVHGDNLVVAGGLAPFECHGKAYVCGSAPLTFMRSFFCLSRTLKPVCRTRARFDVWAHHPYTAGGPTRQAYRRDDASIGDLPEVRSVLAAAYRHGMVASVRTPEFWVTEFSWDTKPPDTQGVPAALHARWVSEALYRMWSSGVRLVTWWTIRDQPYPRSPFQSGLWYRGRSLASDSPKPALQAFRFPFVALPERGGVRVWGRTPTASARAVSVERSTGAGWRRVAVLRANRFGIFTARLAIPARGWMRAVGGAGAVNRTRPFALRRPKDVKTQPFGDHAGDMDK